MKKMRRKMMPALLAAACLTMTTVPAVYAENTDLAWHWGTVATDTFDNMERVDAGASTDINGKRQELYLHQREAVDGTLCDELICVKPNDNMLKFELRTDLDENATIPQILEIIDKYYPGIKEAYDPENRMAVVPVSAARGPIKDRDYELFVGEIGYTLYDYRNDGCSEETADKIRRELAAKGLLSTFLSWGQTAMYSKPCPHEKGVLTFFSKRTVYVTDQPLAFQEESVDIQELYEMFEQNHVDRAEFRKYYEEHATLSDYEQLALTHDDTMQCIKLIAKDEKGADMQFYKVVRKEESGNHVQYYADGDNWKAAVRWLTELTDDSEIVIITDKTIQPTVVFSTAGTERAEKPITVAIELAPLRNYLADNYPDYEIEFFEEDTMFHIHLKQDLSYKEQLALGARLEQQFGVTQYFITPEQANPELRGHDSMEQPGDANLDCVVDILDVIAANKHILGVGTLNKTGVKNADMNGNGTADSEDSLALLKAVLDIEDK